MTLARGFNKTAISRLRAAAGSYPAIASIRVVGPHDHPAAVIVVRRISSNRCGRVDVGRNRVPHLRIPALEIAADERQAAAAASGNVHLRLAEEAHARREQQHTSSLTIAALAVDQTGTEQRALTRLDINLAAAAAAGEDLPGDIDRDIGERSELHFAAGTVSRPDIDRTPCSDGALLRRDAHGSAAGAARLRQTGRSERHAAGASNCNRAAA